MLKTIKASDVSKLKGHVKHEPREMVLGEMAELIKAVNKQNPELVESINLLTKAVTNRRDEELLDMVRSLTALVAKITPTQPNNRPIIEMLKTMNTPTDTRKPYRFEIERDNRGLMTSIVATPTVETIQ